MHTCWAASNEPHDLLHHWPCLETGNLQLWEKNYGRQNEGYRGQTLERGGEDACGHGSNIPFRSQDDKNLNLIFKIKFWCWSVNKTFRPAEESMKKNISLIQTSKCCSKFKRITLKLCLNLLFCVKVFKSCQCHLKF